MEPGLKLMLMSSSVLLILFSQRARTAAGALAIVGLLAGAYGTFVRSASCDGPCRVPLSPTWAALTCWSSADAAVLTEGGRYWLVSSGGAETSGTCLDWRALKSHAGNPF